MEWKPAVLAAISRQCRHKGDSTFSLQELKKDQLDQIIHDTQSIGKTPGRTLERVLQELRDDGFIEFLDNRGMYRLLRSR